MSLNIDQIAEAFCSYRCGRKPLGVLTERNYAIHINAPGYFQVNPPGQTKINPYFGYNNSRFDEDIFSFSA